MESQLLCFNSWTCFIGHNLAIHRGAKRDLITYKFRLYPNLQQERLLIETLETCRHLYNNLLADRNENRAGFYTQKKQLVSWKCHDKHLKAVFSQVLQDVVLRLDKAFQACFKGLRRHPNFRKYGRYNSFTYPQLGFKLKGNNKLYLSKIGDVKIVLHRKVSGVLKRITVIRDIDQWFAAMFVDESNPTEKCADGRLGVDVGLSNVVALSDGTLVSNSHHLKSSVEKIKAAQRNLSRKKKGSLNREKARIALAKAWRKVRRQRDDFCHKLSNDLTKKNELVVFEDLKISNVLKNHNLASAILDATWGRLRVMTVYKAERHSGRVILVDPRGSSQKCSRCGWVHKKRLTLKNRVFHCERCGLELDRDVNAARNILKLGLEQSLVETEPLLVTRISKFQSRKREAHEFICG
jgi:putative transposase